MGLKDALKGKDTQRKKSDLSLIRAHDEYLMSKAKPRRSKFCFHPSQISGCLRKLFYHFIDAEPDKKKGDPKSERILGNGHGVHYRLQKDFYKMGVLKHHYKEEPRIMNWDMLVVGHTDGDMAGEFDGHLLEIKSINNDGFMPLSVPKGDHVEQGHCYMEGLGRDWIIFYYENKDKQLTKEYFYKKDPRIVSLLKDRFKYIQDCIINREEPEKEGKAPSAYICKRCDYKTVCHKSEPLNKKEWDKLNEEYEEIIVNGNEETWKAYITEYQKKQRGEIPGEVQVSRNSGHDQRRRFKHRRRTIRSGS